MGAEPIGSGPTLSMNEEDLNTFIKECLQAFQTALLADTGYQAVMKFEGGQLKLLAGSAPFQAGADIQARFAAFSKALHEILKSFDTQMLDAELAIHRAIEIMKRAHEEALTAAQMMEVLNKVMAGGK